MTTRKQRILTRSHWVERLGELPQDCAGYVDPGTGSYLLQMLLAGVLGAGFAIRSFWSNIRATVSSWKRGKDSPEV